MFDGPGQAILVAPDKTYNSMNFAGQVPAPTLRVTEGDTIRFTLTNRGAIPHSIDFHAARTPWDKNYQTVDAGNRRRADPPLFLMNAGPNNVWPFHVIGALIDHYEQDGNPANAQGLHQTVEVLPGGGALVELRIPEPGKYPNGTHKMNDIEKGAMGLLDVQAP